jgi:hypothetical protein
LRAGHDADGVEGAGLSLNFTSLYGLPHPMPFYGTSRLPYPLFQPAQRAVGQACFEACMMARSVS